MPTKHKVWWFDVPDDISVRSYEIDACAGDATGYSYTLDNALRLLVGAVTADALERGVWSADDVSDVAAALVEEMGKAVEAVKEVHNETR